MVEVMHGVINELPSLGEGLSSVRNVEIVKEIPFELRITEEGYVATSPVLSLLSKRTDRVNRWAVESLVLDLAFRFAYYSKQLSRLSPEEYGRELNPEEMHWRGYLLKNLGLLSPYFRFRA